MGHRVPRNAPYVGGYVMRHHGRPCENIHALQMEVARGLSMDEELIERRPGMAAQAPDLPRLVARLAALNWTTLGR